MNANRQSHCYENLDALKKIQVTCCELGVAAKQFKAVVDIDEQLSLRFTPL